MKKFLLLSLSSVSFLLQASQKELAANRVEDYAAMITLLEIAAKSSQSTSQGASATGQNSFTAAIQSKSGAGKKVYVKNWKCSKCGKKIFGGAKPAIKKHQNSGCEKNHFRCNALGLSNALSICPLKHADLDEFNEHLQRVHPGRKFDSQAAYDQAVAEYNRNA